jgi:hypothetical protein
MNLKIRLANNEEIEARLEVWVSAILAEIPRETSARVFERVRKGNIFYQTPGGYLLKAEGATLSALLKAP